MAADENECQELIEKVLKHFPEDLVCSIDPEDDGFCVGLIFVVNVTSAMRFKLDLIVYPHWHVRWREGTERSGYTLASVLKEEA